MARIKRLGDVQLSPTDALTEDGIRLNLIVTLEPEYAAQDLIGDNRGTIQLDQGSVWFLESRSLGWQKAVFLAKLVIQSVQKDEVPSRKDRLIATLFGVDHPMVAEDGSIIFMDEFDFARVTKLPWQIFALLLEILLRIHTIKRQLKQLVLEASYEMINAWQVKISLKLGEPVHSLDRCFESFVVKFKKAMCLRGHGTGGVWTGEEYADLGDLLK